jgi:(3S)-linalool synthase
MLSLYEASYLGAEGEQVLIKAMNFSKSHLHQSLPHLLPEVRRHVSTSLTLPRHLRMERLEARNYMEEYGQALSFHTPDFLELAKLDSHMVQSLHQTELAEISRLIFYSHDDYYI